MFDEYRFSGSLPENTSTYVTREADSELYQGLKAGKFCYVLNSRQSGKSSLYVRTMRRLKDSGVECASIDLSAGGIQNVPPEQWYADLIDTLIDNFGLDVDFGDWWSKNQLNSLITRLRKFIEEILLREVEKNIVIFIDEIDSVLSLNFPTDDFFAFIRACYNQRADNLNYNRLTFCLLGVASPSNLISDKKRTPFNIGKAITLKGFQSHEVSPLEKGLQEVYPDSGKLMKDILHWTRGQPFLTQKLCQFMLEESLHENPRSVEQVVRTRIIENWESLDEPEHLRTIRDRILRDSVRAGYLLELYQQIRRNELLAEITANDTLEESDLQLSGLVVREENKLKVYNPIYREIFNPSWIETQLKNLRPYSESLQFWIASGGKDKSRLLRGQALQSALKWAKDKSLNYQDREFLAASQAKEKQEAIAVLAKEAELERERKDREAVEKRNFLLAQANQKARWRMRVGVIVLAATLLVTVTLGVQATFWKIQVEERQTYVRQVEQLAKLAGQIQEQGYNDVAEELFSQAGQSAKLQKPNLRQDVLNAGISYAYINLENKNHEKQKKNLNQAKNLLEKIKTDNNSNVGLQLRFLYERNKTLIFEYEKKIKDKDIINRYQKGWEIFNKLKAKNKVASQEISPPFNNEIKEKILSAKNIEAFLTRFKNLLLFSKSDGNTELKKLKKQVFESLKEHYYNELESLLSQEQWENADRRTTKLLLYITERQQEGYAPMSELKNLSCRDLGRIDELWVNKSEGHFGFSVQKEILTKTLGVDLKNMKYEDFRSFAANVGWIKNRSFAASMGRIAKKNNKEHYELWGPYGDDLQIYNRAYGDNLQIFRDTARRGYLPTAASHWDGRSHKYLDSTLWHGNLYYDIKLFFSQCNLPSITYKRSR